MLERLRTATRAAHDLLETDLKLLQPPLRQGRFEHVLARFRAFHLAWEPKVQALIRAPNILASRSRIDLLTRDLAFLGAGPVELRDGPDLGFLVSPAAAWGSLYVMEGSTLGGQVISKAIRQAAWAPQEGFAYFNPYGKRTAAMWSEFRRQFCEHAHPDSENEVVIGALSTFQTLHAWILPVPERGE